MTDQITYIVPAYQCKLTLEKCLSSIPEGREIIIVGRDQSDLFSVLEKFPHTRYVEAKLPGAAHARNLGASFAKGAYIAFLDADSWLSSDYSEPTNLAQYDIMLFSIQIQVIADGALSRFLRDRKRVVNKSHQDIIAQNFFLYVDTAFMIVESKFFLARGGFREDLLRFEDREFGYRLQIFGARIRYDLSDSAIKGIDETSFQLVRKKIRDIFHQARIIFSDYRAYRKHIPEASLLRKLRVEIEILKATKPSAWIVLGWVPFEFALAAFLKIFYSCWSFLGTNSTRTKPETGTCLISIGPNNFMKSFEGE